MQVKLLMHAIGLSSIYFGWAAYGFISVAVIALVLALVGVFGEQGDTVRTELQDGARGLKRIDLALLFAFLMYGTISLVLFGLGVFLRNMIVG